MNKKVGSCVNTLLRKERLSRGWSQQDLANHLEITIVTVNRWERGTQQPSPLFRLKLCKLFAKDEEALGLGSRETTADSVSFETLSQEQDLFPVPLLNVSSLQESGNTVVISPPIHLSGSSQNLPVLQTTQHVFDESVQRSSPPLAQRQKVGLKQRVPLMLHKLLFGISFMLIIANILFFLHGPLSLFIHKVALLPLTHSSTPTQPFASGRLLYQAQWSKDQGEWIASSHWHWSDQEGGMIVTDSMTNSMMLAPYQLAIPAYAIEATIQRLSYSYLDGNSYGIVVGKTSANGEVCGIGSHEKPEHFFIGQLATPITLNQPHILADVFRSPVVLDTLWHTYRVEITPGHIRLFFENRLVGQVNNDTHIQGGQVGISTVGAFIRIKRFTIFAL